MRLLFLRHGQDDESCRGGWSTLGLVPEGAEQSRRAAEYLRSSEYDIRGLFSSDLPRAMETAEYLSDALGLPIQKEAALREMNNGVLAGMANSEAQEKYPGLYFSTLGMEEAYPGGESPLAFFRRVQAWFAQLRENPPATEGDLLVVTHGGVINILCHLVWGIPWSNQRKSVPAGPCSLHVLDMDTMTFESENKTVWEGGGEYAGNK